MTENEDHDKHDEQDEEAKQREVDQFEDLMIRSTGGLGTDIDQDRLQEVCAAAIAHHPSRPVFERLLAHGARCYAKPTPTTKNASS